MDTGRSNDSGVASPSEETGEAGDKESGARRSGGKSRTESGEDAGIGSEQGENIIILLLTLIFGIHTILCKDYEKLFYDFQLIVSTSTYVDKYH